MKEKLAKSELRVEAAEKENNELKKTVVNAENGQKRAEETAKSLKENRGKVLRGLSTQTEIAIAQFRKDLDYMSKQLESKDEIIRLHEKKIKTLIEANCTLRNGLQMANRNMHDSESEEENGFGSVPNGIGDGSGGPVQTDLANFIKQLDV